MAQSLPIFSIKLTNDQKQTLRTTMNTKIINQSTYLLTGCWIVYPYNQDALIIMKKCETQSFLGIALLTEQVVDQKKYELDGIFSEIVAKSNKHEIFSQDYQTNICGWIKIIYKSRELQFSITIHDKTLQQKWQIQIQNYQRLKNIQNHQEPIFFKPFFIINGDDQPQQQNDGDWNFQYPEQQAQLMDNRWHNFCKQDQQIGSQSQIIRTNESLPVSPEEDYYLMLFDRDETAKVQQVLKTLVHRNQQFEYLSICYKTHLIMMKYFNFYSIYCPHQFPCKRLTLLIQITNSHLHCIRQSNSQMIKVSSFEHLTQSYNRLDLLQNYTQKQKILLNKNYDLEQKYHKCQFQQHNLKNAVATFKDMEKMLSNDQDSLEFILINDQSAVEQFVFQAQLRLISHPYVSQQSQGNYLCFEKQLLFKMAFRNLHNRQQISYQWKQFKYYQTLIKANQKQLQLILSQHTYTLKHVVKFIILRRQSHQNQQQQYSFQLASEQGQPFRSEEQRDCAGQLWDSESVGIWIISAVKGLVELQKLGITHLNIALRNTVMFGKKTKSPVFKIIDFDWAWKVKLNPQKEQDQKIHLDTLRQVIILWKKMMKQAQLRATGKERSINNFFIELLFKQVTDEEERQILQDIIDKKQSLQDFIASIIKQMQAWMPIIHQRQLEKTIRVILSQGKQRGRQIDWEPIQNQLSYSERQATYFKILKKSWGSADC